MIRLDLTGKRFGSLTVIKPMEERRKEKVIWESLCDCGNTHKVAANDLTTGHTKSCGCKHHPIKHGESTKRLYTIHQCMKRRCYNPNNTSYKDYGGKGITICDEWLNSYEAFRDWALNNGYNDGLTIERKNNDKGYSPDNCTWITKADQNRNKKNTIQIYIDGERTTLPMLSEAIGLSASAIYLRYLDGVRGLDLIRLAKRKGRQREVEINGTLYNNLRELSEKTGIAYSTLKWRYKNGDRGERLIRPKE